MQLKLDEITGYLESIAPLRFQEGYDNAGLIYGHPDQLIDGILFSLDCTEPVVTEAIDLKYNLVVAHHPIIFKGIRKFNPDNYVERSILKAIKNDIAIYAIHTNLDNVLSGGVNEKIAQVLGLKQLKPLKTHAADHLEPDYSVGAGVIGELDEAYQAQAFLTYLKEAMNLSMIRHTAILDKPIQRVAVCGGAGSFLLEDAIRAGADIYISADFKYHEFFDANEKIVIADIGHYESEYFTIELLLELVRKKFPNFAARCTKVTTNPVNYF